MKSAQRRCPFLTDLRHSLTRLGTAEQGILIAVSGGADSMAILHGILKIAEEIDIRRIEVAHLNHGLRGSESDADAELVQYVCTSLGVPLTIESLAAGKLKANSRGSLEESARIARYEFLYRTAASQRLSLIATAHHQQDQVETLLFSLLRGTGLRGLCGIPESRLVSPEIRIIRPLLTISRAIVRHFIDRNGIAYRDDSSNNTAAFARNGIRQLMQAMPVEHSGFLEQRLLRLSQQALLTIRSMDLVAEVILSESLLEATADVVRLDRIRLSDWPEPLMRHALILQWTRQNWPRQQMNTAQWQRMSVAALTGKPRRWSFPDGVELSVHRTLLRLKSTGAQ